MLTQKSFTITKKIAKHGNQAVIIVPSLLQEQLQPGMIVELKIEIIE
jgi:antitoxin component of MazEF toxin-antitoxin module